MSGSDLDPRFWDRADQVIQLANSQCEQDAPSRVSASLLYAASRFNAFIVALNASNAEEMSADKERAVDYFTEQFRKMLLENLDDHIKKFDDYVGR